MSKFTPGPWIIDPVTRPFEICTVHGLPKNDETNHQGWAYIRGELNHLSADKDEKMANAHLIAAAPDFYAAAKIFQEYERACDDGDDVTMMLKYEKFASRINAAIAKAEGTTP